MVTFRSGEAVHRHPELKDFLNDGWEVERAVPTLSDAKSVQLQVVLNRTTENTTILSVGADRL